MRIFGKRRLAGAVAVVAAAAVMCIAGPTASASAATSVLYAHLNPLVHTCTVIGDAVSPYDGIDYQGVVCVDLRAFTGGPVEADAEAICQVGPGQSKPYGTEVQCAHVIYGGGLFNPVNGGMTMVSECGHDAGPCSTTRNIWQLGTQDLYDTNPQTCASDLQDNYWAVVFGAPSTNFVDRFTQIELPGSGKWVFLNTSNANDASGNQTTGHYQICP